ncbi:metallophosphoesterase family protein [Shewanella surugensis]|uniref:Metallophosphoesterase n=1 Tax=Shewanella surugensis TaxID=212020 RepID=A0ABT0LBU3_9GAMM|nr:metallophosphoesterase [Shewanella surugensis]MCL1125049.1 metallophosphoesterase [Shewanella surugensis]
MDQTFSFGVQGDSHPDRPKSLYNEALYQLNIDNVAANQPDLFFMLGDDFSIEDLISSNTINQDNVNDIYAAQREYLKGAMNNTALYLVNGHHEQAARYIYDGNFDYDENYSDLANAPIYATNARNYYYSLPAPNDFYSGDKTQLENIGFLRDYYAWQWGNALFVTIDPYWHSPVVVDSGIPPLYKKESDPWAITMGDEQYQWLKKTLANSTAKYKFVFAHHVNGRGRGAATIVHSAEWGGYDKNGKNYEFSEYRPNWDLPIHQLMVKNNVTIFFQGHDHVYSKEIVDGVIYQSLPSPADNSEDSWLKYAHYYAPDSIALPNAKYDPNLSVILPPSGHLNVIVSPDNVTVDYVSSVLPEDETDNLKNGDIIYSYDVNEQSLNAPELNGL